MGSFSIGDILFILLVGGIVLSLLRLVAQLRRPGPPEESAPPQDPASSRDPKE